MSTLRSKLSFLTDPYNSAAILLALVLVCLKKWEPGGNLDTIWYSAVSRNVAETGNYFHFFVSSNWDNRVTDHMPLTYWVVGTLMSWFGISDFVARLYPMLTSIASILFVYGIGRQLSSARFGLLAIVAYAFCLGAGKWHGALMQDVPLTTWFLGATYCLIRAAQNPKWFYGTSIFFVLGVWTKGPIIFGFGLAMILWILTERKWTLLKTRHFLGAALLILLLLATFYLPSLRFDGRDYYSVWIGARKDVMVPSTGGFSRHFAFLDVLWVGAFLVIPFFFYSIWRLFLKANSETSTFKSWVRLFIWMVVCVVVPLSFFNTKYPHYILPVYPFLALVAASGFRSWVESLAPRTAELVAIWLRGIAIAVAFVFAMTPLKTTGQRGKELINSVNLIKLDRQINQKTVAFLGHYLGHHSVAQNFKFYGDIDLKWVESSEASEIDLSQSWLVIPTSNLPFEHKAGTITEANCVVGNSVFCAVTSREGLQFHAPDSLFPHEIYSRSHE